MKNKSLIVEANERVSIVMACRLAGIEVEDGLTGGSMKTYCPFGRFFHSDGGKEPAFRIYPESNSAYCFSCKKFFSPTTLISDAFDISKKQAAKELLDRVGYKPLTAAEMWAGVQPKEPEPDTSMLSMALKTYCLRIDPDWQKTQFEPDVGSYLDRCLSLLDQVHTGEEAEAWLTTCKLAMKKFLDQRVTV